MPKVNLEKVPPFYHNYINQVPEDDLAEAFEHNARNIISLIKTISDDKWMYRYAPGKWSIKEMIQHMIDAERIFCYRALTFARFDDKLLPGFDENHYAAVSKADNRNSTDLIEELELVQRASAKLFGSFTEDQLKAEGTANNNRIYVEAIGYIIVGHNRHHINILKERYLS